MSKIKLKINESIEKEKVDYYTLKWPGTFMELKYLVHMKGKPPWSRKKETEITESNISRARERGRPKRRWRQEVQEDLERIKVRDKNCEGFGRDKKLSYT